jgi:hypothetical protein
MTDYERSAAMTDTQCKPRTYKINGLATFLRVLTLVFAFLGFAVILLTAALLGDWDSTAFGFFIVIILEVMGTLYLSVLTFLWELTRRIRRVAGRLSVDKPFGRVLHSFLLWMAVGGSVSFALIPMSFSGSGLGVTILIHYAFGVVLTTLYLVLWVYTLVCRIMDHRRAEAQRLEEERQAWEGYLT